MNKRSKLVLIIVPILFAVIIGVITTLSLPIFSFGPEKISIYSTSYVATDFTVDDVTIRYYTPDELTVYFHLSGGDDAQDLDFEFICRDASGDHIYSSANGTLLIQAVGYPISNSTSIGNGDLVTGVLTWSAVPSGSQKIKAVITLDNIAVDTESFYIGLK